MFYKGYLHNPKRSNCYLSVHCTLSFTPSVRRTWSKERQNGKMAKRDGVTWKNLKNWKRERGSFRSKERELCLSLQLWFDYIIAFFWLWLNLCFLTRLKSMFTPRCFLLFLLFVCARQQHSLHFVGNFLLFKLYNS